MHGMLPTTQEVVLLLLLLLLVISALTLKWIQLQREYILEDQQQRFFIWNGDKNNDSLSLLQTVLCEFNIRCTDYFYVYITPPQYFSFSSIFNNTYMVCLCRLSVNPEFTPSFTQTDSKLIWFMFIHNTHSHIIVVEHHLWLIPLLFVVELSLVDRILDTPPTAISIPLSNIRMCLSPIYVSSSAPYNHCNPLVDTPTATYTITTTSSV